MAVIYDHSVTGARRLVDRHQPVRSPATTRQPRHSRRCAAGCAEWPCKPFSAAWAIVTRNSHSWVAR